MSKNRIIIEYDAKLDSMVANVASSTHETKSRASVITKNGKLYVKTNSFVELIPIFIVFKAMGIESEQVSEGMKRNLKDFFNSLFLR